MTTTDLNREISCGNAFVYNNILITLANQTAIFIAAVTLIHIRSTLFDRRHSKMDDFDGNVLESEINMR